MLEAVGECLTVDGARVWAIFEMTYSDALDGPGIGSTEPEITGRTSDLANVMPGAIVARDTGEQFRVRESEPDGTGLTLMRLRRG